MNFRPAPIRYALFERAIMRVLFAVIVARHIPSSLAHFTISTPHGIGRVLDLHFLLDPATFAICRYLLWAALALYVARIGWSIALPYMTLLSIATGTIVNSQGAIGHYFQIVSLVLCAQTAAHFYDLFQKRVGALAEDRIVFWSQQAIVATYFTSALTKLIHTSGRWFFQSPMVAVQIIKTTDQDYYDRLDLAQRNAGLPLAEWILTHPLIVALVLGAGLLLELTSPLALLGRRFALFFGVSLIVFHESVQRLMKLDFAYNEYLIWVYLVNVPFWLWFAARRLGGSKPLPVSP